MASENHQKNTWLDTGRQMVLTIAALGLLIGVGVFSFLKFYNRYDDELLYAERLSQMREVTGQLFSGLEDIVDVQWEKTQAQCSYLKDAAPKTVDEMVTLMRKQMRLNHIGDGSDIVAFDTQGHYYSQNGKQGMIAGMQYLEGEPEQVSYVFNEMTTTLTQMLFLYRLDEPLTLQDEDGTAEIIYYGLALNMDILNPYFSCDAYGGNNSTYVVDDQGLKLFSGSGNGDLLKGFNVFSVLRDMQYLHGFSFDSTLQTLRETGMVYSNAVLNGEEYYYALYRMANSEWTLLFLVPSIYVATNTIQLVNTTTRLLMIFAVFMAIICAGMIFIILRVQQHRALRLADETNAVLEANNRKLELAQAETAQALKTAEVASTAKTNFLANMSHDIRTPMNAIVGITKLMAHDKDDPVKMETYIHKVQLSSQHLLSLINDVLDMSKIESSAVVLNTEKVNLAEQIRQIESIIRPQTEERDQHLAIRIRDIRHEYLLGDSVRLRQIFINLLSNAVKYTQNGGDITLEVEERLCKIADHAAYRITVADNGYGMTEEFVRHIFEPFTRAENSTTNKIQGTGLGMAITKNIVDLMGGTVAVESAPGKGSRFAVDLSLAIDKEEKASLDCGKVLLITDDPLFLRNVQAAFRETEAPLLTAGTEAEADELLSKEAIDVVLLGGCPEGRTLEDNLHRLREKTGKALLFYCCDYDGLVQLSGIGERGDVDGILPRPLFLSSLANAIQRIQAQVPAVSEDSSGMKGLRFLCAEDNALNAEILTAVLDMQGASCVIYPDGKQLVEAFANIQEGEYDAILMDVQMPIMNGLDATRAIRRSANPLGRTIPIIAMTANAFSEDVQNCLNAGMNAHIAKPLDIAALERTVRSVLGGKFSGGGDTCTPIEDK